MNYRRALAEDLAGVASLQNDNLMTHLEPDKLTDGFLSGSFTEEQFSRMNDDLCVVVCLDADRVVGFLCTSTTDYNRQFGLPAAMIARYPHATYGGRPLSAFTSFVAGPVCVDKQYRGMGIFEGLYRALVGLLPVKYEVVVTFVSVDNPRSIHAHEKVGLKKVDHFEFSGREFVILATGLQEVHTKVTSTSG